MDVSANIIGMWCTRNWVALLLLHLFLVHSSQSLAPEDLEELEEMAVEVIVDSSPCSVTCGLGVKRQMLCFLKNDMRLERGGEEDGKKWLSEMKDCRERKVRCLETWQCGLKLVTVMMGERLEMDCLGEVMEAMGRYSWRVSWRYARGVISSDDSLFARWKAARLDQVILDPVREEDAGTYRCDVQDTGFRRVKRVYQGVLVLPRGVLNLDYASSLARWEWTGPHQNLTTASGPRYHSTAVRDMMLTSSLLAGALVSLILMGLYWAVLKKGNRERRREEVEEGGVGGGIPIMMEDVGGEGQEGTLPSTSKVTEDNDVESCDS
ncbi:transmembrane protein 81 [Lampris incognitus]|uniref:transmembrane protein 81 n=1 Tax=Lampris incognitus TaxID=2546036 RepID=UPI0024B5B2FA|nr:transmembrane protein 81 [Lampris incognitus]